MRSAGCLLCNAQPTGQVRLRTHRKVFKNQLLGFLNFERNFLRSRAACSVMIRRTRSTVRPLPRSVRAISAATLDQVAPPRLCRLCASRKIAWFRLRVALPRAVCWKRSGAYWRRSAVVTSFRSARRKTCFPVSPQASAGRPLSNRIRPHAQVCSRLSSERNRPSSGSSSHMMKARPPLPALRTVTCLWHCHSHPGQVIARARSASARAPCFSSVGNAFAGQSSVSFISQ